MAKMLRLVISLTVIAGVCAAVLAYVNEATAQAISDERAAKTESAAKAVMPEGVVTVEALAEGGPYVGRAASGAVVGYAVKGAAGGYGGDVELMAGFRADALTLVAYRTLKATETPGLGMKLNEPAFARQFCGRRADTLKVRKDGGEIEAITSATITSRAVCAALRAAAAQLGDVRNGKGGGEIPPAGGGKDEE